MAKITGKNDGTNGRNETYRVGNKNVKRSKVIKEIEQGKHEGYHVVEINNEKYARGDPDKSKNNNVNQDE